MLAAHAHYAEPVGANHERTSFAIRIPRHFPRTMGQGHRAGGIQNAIDQFYVWLDRLVARGR